MVSRYLNVPLEHPCLDAPGSLLAKRIIHITMEKICFECYSTDASEEGDIIREMPLEKDSYLVSLELRHLLGLIQHL